METRFAAADLVIFLDISCIVCLASAMRRLGRKRDDMPEGLKQPSAFSKASRDFYKWIWDYPATGRNIVLALHQQHFGTTFLRVRSRRQIRCLLTQWGLNRPTPVSDAQDLPK